MFFLLRGFENSKHHYLSLNYLIKHIPLSRTAGCIFFTCEFLNISINKSDITKVCSISDVTVNKCYQKLLKIKDEIIENTELTNYK